ncbi:glycosyltransferase [Solibacillus sp. CAU 1738]|uniref:glycosyltransferase n=1 Tax=Solibacillus sp. CAU 1738 TaxID=3140363 RepID=UPI003261B4BA
MSMMRLLWIGCLESEEEFKIKSKKGYNLASAQVSQLNIINGIEEVSGLRFDSINGSVLPPYPRYSDKIIEEVIWSHKENTFNISVGYKNIKGLNRITCKYSMINAVKIWVRDMYKGEKLVVFAYSMRSPVMAAACEIKKLIPDAKIILIVTDLPQYMDLGQSKLKALLKKFDWLHIKRMQKEFDGFILYAQKMAEFLKIPNEKWLLMEGSYDVKDTLPLKINSYKKSKVIMYSGKLDIEYGIGMLVSAFMKIPMPDLELWITGGGNAEEWIKDCVIKDSRIKFYGFLPLRGDVLKKQMDASLLVNMRLPSERASAYCFPSKLFEYMASNIPVLSFKLGGIPLEYYKHLIIVDNETQESLISAITSVFNLNDESRNFTGQKAREFILSKKTKEHQCKRIWKFVKKV